MVAKARQVKSKASAAPSQDAIIADILARLAGSGLSSEDRQRLQNQLAAALAPYPGSGGNKSGGWRIRREVAGLTSGFTAQDTSGAKVNVQALAAGALPRLPTTAKTGDVTTVAITSSPVDTTAIYSAAVETAIRTSREARLLADQASGARARAEAAQAAARDAARDSANAARVLSDAQKAIDVIKQALADDTLSSAQRLNLLASRAGAEITLTEAIDEAAATESRAASAQAHALARTAEALAAEKTAVLAKTAAEAAEREKNRARNAAWPPLPPGERAMAAPRILVAGR